MSAMRGQGWGRGDELGTWAPIGGSGGEKELIRFPRDVENLAPAAATLMRGRIRDDLRGLYGLAASLAGDHKPTLAFIANMAGAGLGVNGFARNEYLMGLVRMISPASMPQTTNYYRGGDGQGKQTSTFKRSNKGKPEEDE